MRSQICITRNIVRVLMTASLLVFLNGCGGNSGNKQSGTLSPTQTVNSRGTLSPTQTVNSQGGLDVDGLHIMSDNAECELGPNYTDQLPESLTTRGHLVLATNRLTYDVAELHQMAAYVKRFDDPVPSTLRLVHGGLAGKTDPLVSDPACWIKLEITNLGKTPIQIQTFNTRLAAPPQQNSYYYRLIDICSLLPAPQGGICAPQLENGVEWGYLSSLKEAPKNTVFPTHTFEPQAGGVEINPEFTINPGEPVSVKLSFESVGQPDNLIYTVFPELVLASNGGGTRQIELPQFKRTLAFADSGQYTCFKLQGNSFVPEPKLIPNDAPRPWCP